MTTRTIRLTRTADLRTMHRVVADLTADADVARVRDCVVLVPTRASALQLRETLERLWDDACSETVDRALALPEILTRDDWYRSLHDRARIRVPRLTGIEREILLGAAARDAVSAGAEPPFRIRPGLVAEMLAFYDALARCERSIDDFERLATADLEPRAEYDRGAERLLRQTHFLVAAFRAFETRQDASGALDEHVLRRRLLDETTPPTFRRVVVTVADHAAEPTGGLCPADFSLLTRLPHLESVEIVATDAQLAAGLHERLHALLPELSERVVDALGPAPRLGAPGLARDRLYWTSRDREEELRAIARRIKRDSREEDRSSSRVAVVFRRPLPYVYLARTVFDAGGIEFQTSDTLPLAAEPYAAAVDLVLTAVATRFGRAAMVALLRSSAFVCTDDPSGAEPDAASIDALDRRLGEIGFGGGLEGLTGLADRWEGEGLSAARAAAALAREIEPLGRVAPVSAHVATLITFLQSRDRAVSGDEVTRTRYLRARRAILGGLERIGRAAARLDDPLVRGGDVAAIVRRWIEARTFAPRRGSGGVHLVDAPSARYGDFDTVHLAGLVEGDWPERSGRNIFYPAFLLATLGWPPDSARAAAERAAFVDLLHLSRDRVYVSSFVLEDDSIVTASALLDEVERSGLAVERTADPEGRCFADEALADGVADAADPIWPRETASWLALRAGRSPAAAPEFHGSAGRGAARAHSVSAIDRYLQCPFKYFAATVLALPEEVTDEPTLAPRLRGQFVHRVLERFYAAWRARGGAEITVDRLPEARALFSEIVERSLRELPPSEIPMERLRLVGSVATPGIGDQVLGAEASRPESIEDRLLEHQFDGEFTIAVADGSRVVRLRGVVDRVDLLADDRFRVIDYKTGKAPDPKLSVQLPVYAVCIQQVLARRDGRPWTLAEAAYLAFGERQAWRPVIGDRGDAAAKLAEGAGRLLSAIDGIEHGDFPPRPAERRLCAMCAYATVCRKDYVDGD